MLKGLVGGARDGRYGVWWLERYATESAKRN
jgi:hypothetical protein